MTETVDIETLAATITPEEFSLEVERRAWTDKDEDSYLYHAARYGEELEIEPEQVKRLISQSLLDKIRHEASKNKQLKERNTTSSLL